MGARDEGRALLGKESQRVARESREIGLTPSRLGWDRMDAQSQVASALPVMRCSSALPGLCIDRPRTLGYNTKLFCHLLQE